MGAHSITEVDLVYNLYFVSIYREPSPSWEVCHLARQAIPYLLWNPKVHYHVHKSLPPAPMTTLTLKLSEVYKKVARAGKSLFR